MEGTIDNTFFFNGSKSTDNIGIIQYTWNLGDGTIKNGKEINHQYSEIGSYNVTLIIQDTKGNEKIDWIIVEVKSASDYFYLTIIGISFALLIVLIGYRQKFGVLMKK